MIVNWIRLLYLVEQELLILAKLVNFAYLSGAQDDSCIVGPFVQLSLIRAVEFIDQTSEILYFDPSFAALQNHGLTITLNYVSKWVLEDK